MSVRRRIPTRDFLNKPISIALFLLLVTVLSYGILVHKLGFYWDDWPKAWFLHILGPSGFDEVYAVDRPNLAWTYLVTTWIVGESPLAWQVFGIFSHWLSAIAVWSLVRTIWRGRPFIALSAALLFLVYPGFTQSSIALIYSHYFLLLAAHVFSLELMVRATQSRRYALPLTLASLALGLYSLLSIEYFLGFELLRPLLLWWVLEDPGQGMKGKIWGVFRRWIPYLLVPVIFLVWRVFVVEFPTYTPGLLGSLYHAPEIAIPDLFTTILNDLFTVSVHPWVTGILLFGDMITEPLSLGLIVAALVLLMVGLYGLLAFRADRRNRISGVDNAPFQVFMTGLWMMFSAGWPFWLTLLEIKIGSELDRFTLPFILGVSLLLTGLIAAWWRSTRKVWIAILFLAFFAGIGTASQIQRQVSFQSDWEMQRSFLWQFIWRVPDLQPGTVVLMESLPSRSDDESMAAALNWIYGSEDIPGNMPYMVLNLDIRLGDSIQELSPGAGVFKKFRARSFSGSLDRSLVLAYQEPGCLRLLGDEELELVDIPPLTREAIPLSRIDLVVLDKPLSRALPLDIIGPEPERDWCYYFQRAELARQGGDWIKIAELGDRAAYLGLQPADPSELAPFIEGYLKVGRYTDAERLSHSMLEQKSELKPYLCSIWGRVHSQHTTSPPAFIERLSELGCQD